MPGYVSGVVLAFWAVKIAGVEMLPMLEVTYTQVSIKVGSFVGDRVHWGVDGIAENRVDLKVCCGGGGWYF